MRITIRKKVSKDYASITDGAIMIYVDRMLLFIHDFYAKTTLFTKRVSEEEFFKIRAMIEKANTRDDMAEISEKIWGVRI